MAAVLCFTAICRVGHASQALEVPCATAQSPDPLPLAVSAAELAAARRVVPRETGFDIVVTAGAALSANAAAMAAFERAVQQWEALFTDPISVNINANLANLQSANTIGTTAAVKLQTAYDGMRNALVGDAADESDDSIVASLPTSAQFGYLMPSGFTRANVFGTKANLKALGFAGLDGSFGASDGTITLNSQFSFDYDNSNGVSAGTLDFETVVAHEIGHLLGFSSCVDTIDNLVESGSSGAAVDIGTLDLLRFRRAAPDNPATAAQFTTFPRSMTYGTDDITDDIDGEARMSTGAFHGDGRQASHWKDDSLTGSHIGLMDPTLGSGQVFTITASDVRALDLIGYETAPCGDGNVDAGEDCDDGNRQDGDCCSSGCFYESAGAACASDGNVCTDDTCDGAGSCTHAANAASCEDGIFCNGPDVCSGGICTHAGDPCSGGGECNDICNEAASNCQEPAGTPCASDGNVCTADVCGSGSCTHVAAAGPCDDGLFCNGTDACSGGACSVHSGDPCTTGGECSAACNEDANACGDSNGAACSDDGNPCTSDVCSGNVCTHPPTSAACDDGVFCNGADSCSGGTCTVHSGDPCVGGGECANVCSESADACSAPASTPCTDDGDVCTIDACDGDGSCSHVFDGSLDPACDACPPSPEAGCRVSSRASLVIGNSDIDGADSLSWKWLAGQATTQEELGAPDSDTVYRLCVYVGDGVAASLAAELAVDHPTGWTSKSPKGWSYMEQTGSQSGVSGIRLGAGPDGRAKQQWKARGEQTVLPEPVDEQRYFHPSAVVVVQARHSLGQCWTSAFAAAAMKLNLPPKVKASSELCGDHTAIGLEQCDGSDDEACPGECDADCSCLP